MSKERVRNWIFNIGLITVVDFVEVLPIKILGNNFNPLLGLTVESISIAKSSLINLIGRQWTVSALFYF